MSQGLGQILGRHCFAATTAEDYFYQLAITAEWHERVSLKLYIKHAEDYFIHNCVKIVFLDKIVKRLNYLFRSIIRNNMSYKIRLFGQWFHKPIVLYLHGKFGIDIL